jgi:hypothetical protein
MSDKSGDKSEVPLFSNGSSLLSSQLQHNHTLILSKLTAHIIATSTIANFTAMVSTQLCKVIIILKRHFQTSLSVCLIIKLTYQFLFIVVEKV